MTSLTDLATHVEGLDGPCLETDLSISKALGFDTEHFKGKFTSSVDAALTLVPEGLRLDIQGFAYTKGEEWKAEICGRNENGMTWSASSMSGVAQTLPLAIVTSCLRARAEEV
jgi:hypothetical protein